MSCIGNSRQAETASLPNAEVCQVVVKHPFMFSLCPSVKYILHSYFDFYIMYLRGGTQNSIII